MIRLRDSKGNIIPTPKDTNFFEILDEEGAVAVVFFYDPVHKELVSITQKDTAEASRYKEMFGVNFVPIVNVILDSKQQ